MANKGLADKDITRFLNIIWLPGEVRELRIPNYNKYRWTASGYFDTPDSLANAVADRDGKANLYVTLNPVDPALMARSYNRVNERAEHASADADILYRRWLLIDIDPVRPSGISSTEAEREAAFRVLTNVTHFLTTIAWPEPVTAMSGNGYYALYRIDLPNNTESDVIVRTLLEFISSKFSTAVVHIDTTVYNASRMVALIGTMKRKGDSTTDRPHRCSQLISIPVSLIVVQEELLQTVSNQALKPVKLYQRHDSDKIGQMESLRTILDRQGIEYRIQPPDAQGFTWYHVRQCPFHDDGHPFECGVGQKLPDGPYSGHCFHPEGAGAGWQEWKEKLELRVGLNDQSLSLTSSNNDTDIDGSLRLTDTWNARRLVSEHHNDLLWCEAFKQWFIYDGTRYARDLTREVERRAESTVTDLYTYAAAFTNSDERRKVARWAVMSESRQRMSNMIESAKRMVPVHPGDFDRDPLLFNVLNGTIDLSTQKLRQHRREDFADLSRIRENHLCQGSCGSTRTGRRTSSGIS